MRLLSSKLKCGYLDSLLDEVLDKVKKKLIFGSTVKIRNFLKIVFVILVSEMIQNVQEQNPSFMGYFLSQKVIF